MFRRRTDHVYSTLQQVQRRISEQGGGPAPAPAPVPGSDTGRFQRPTDHFTPATPTPAAVPPPLPSPAFPGVAMAPPQPGIVLTLPVAVVMLLVALMLCVLSFFVGRLSAAPAPAMPPREERTAERGPVAPPVSRPRHILLIGRPFPAITPALETDSRRLNAMVGADGNLRAAGVEAFFGIYVLESGEKVLAYGWTDAWRGVDQHEPRYVTLYNALRNVRTLSSQPGDISATLRWLPMPNR